MARNYTDLVAKVRDWSNRDSDVLNDERIGDFLLYAADKAYRTLRIPPLERTFTISPVEGDDAVENNRIPVPADLIEFIHIRAVDYLSDRYDVVFNNKADTRTFHDAFSEKYNTNYTWTRQGNYLLFTEYPGIQAGRTYEVFYYGRLAQLGTSYNRTLENYLLGVVTLDGSKYVEGDVAPDETTFNAAVAEDDAAAEAGTSPYTIRVVPDEVFNWLVQENERILLFGALAEAFTYLAEDDMAAKYLQLFQVEIQELNKEEGQRHASGGNVQVNFNGRGLI